MDQTEDLSARVLLNNIISTEPPRTPITRSASKAQSPRVTRRSSRLSKKDAVVRTPQEILRRSLKYKVRESITSKSLSATTRRMTTSSMLQKTNTPGLTSMLFEDDDTPRHILRHILQTVLRQKILDLHRKWEKAKPSGSYFEDQEPVRSPVVIVKAASEEPQLPSANSSISSKRPSIELSGLDLPDLTLGNVGTTTKGLSRKRPRRSLNVTAFEKRLKGASDFQEEHEESAENNSSLSLSSSSSLSLKTPFVDVGSEKRGLQRKVSNCRKLTEEEFGAAVNKQWLGHDHTKEVELNHTTYSEGFTLGLSSLSEPNITTDIVNCNTALYTQQDPMTSTFSIMATQDKATVMASQLQRQITELEQSKLGKDKNEFVFPTEVVVLAETQNEECVSEGQSEKDVETAECCQEETNSRADGHQSNMTELEGNRGEAEEEGEEDNEEVNSLPEDDVQAKSQIEEEQAELQSEREDGEEGAADSQSGVDVKAGSQTEEEAELQSEKDYGGEGAADSQSGEDVEAGSPTEEEEAELQSEKDYGEEGAADSQSGEDVEAGSPTEEEKAELQSEKDYGGEGVADSQSGEDVEAGSPTEEEEAQLQSGEEGADDSQSQEDGSPSEELGDDEEDYQHDQEDPEARSLSEEDKDVAKSQNEDEHEEEAEQTSQQLEHISRRSRLSQGRLVLPLAEAERSLPDVSERGRSKVLSTDPHISLESGGHDSSPPRSKTPDVKESLTQGQDAVDPVEQEEEWEDEDDDEEIEEFPCKTPAFVKEKRNFYLTEHQTSPPVHGNIQTSSANEAVPAAKPKQVRQKKREPAEKQASLPKSYLMNVFRHFAKTKVSSDVYPVLKETMDQFFDRLADDLESYANHAKRKTIEFEDTVLLLKRLGYVNDKVPVEALIEKYLRMDQRRLLIPIATSGNVVVPKQRR